MRPPTAGEVEFVASAGDQPLSPTEERLAHNLSQGIRPPEGADAFARALALGEPQVVVSSLDLDTLIAQAAESAAAAPKAGQAFERPDLDTPTSSRATTSSGCSPASGRSCSASARSASRTASSTSAATR